MKERLLGSCAPSTMAHHLLPPAGWSLVRARSHTGDKSEQVFTSRVVQYSTGTYWFVRVAIRKYHKLGGLTTETIFFPLTGLEAGCASSRSQQGLLHSEASLLGWQMATYLLSFSCIHKHLWHLCVRIFCSYKIPVRLDPSPPCQSHITFTTS